MLKKLPKPFRKFLPFFLIFAAFLLLEASYLIAQNQLSERLPFGVQIADAEYSLVTADEAIAELETRAENFKLRAMLFEVDGMSVEISPAEFDLNFAIAKKISVLKSDLFNFGEISLPTSLNEKRLRKVLLAHFPELDFGATDSRVFLNEKNELEILPERSGRETDFSTVAAKIKEHAGTFLDEKIVIESDPIEPKIFASELEGFRDELADIVKQKLVLRVAAYERFEVHLIDRLAWFDFDGEKVVLKEDAIKNFAAHELNPLLAELPRDVAISRNFDGVVMFDGIAKSGRAVDSEKLFEGITAALSNGQHEIEIPFRVLPSPVKVSPELKSQGIQELVGEAMTSYEGSPANRQHNIRVAAEKLNGKIIPAGEEFSFVDNLGYLTISNGYRQELIIKNGDITPEVGGGVCQVSTTFFRTALDAGLPITRQRPHSMKVTYYDPPGLDATIYPGSADLKFLNDTASPILIQTAVEGTTLRVNFFGTKDDRSVTIAGPFYPNGEAITNLQSAGLRMFWTREVEKDGEIISEQYNAAYRLMPEH